MRTISEICTDLRSSSSPEQIEALVLELLALGQTLNSALVPFQLAFDLAHEEPLYLEALLVASETLIPILQAV